MLRINGKDYELKYTINTLCQMCDSGIDVMDLANLKINIKTVRELFMFGLKHENKKITQAQAGELMDAFFEDGGDYNEIVTEIMTKLNKSLGVSEEPVEEDGEGK